jgi:hypothetical protein
MTVPTLPNEAKLSKKNALLLETEHTSYFRSRKHEMAFYFKINNVVFDKNLGIKRIHLVNLEKARELKNYYLGIFHPDHNKDSDSGLNYDEVCADISATFYRVSGGKLS